MATLRHHRQPHPGDLVEAQYDAESVTPPHQIHNKNSGDAAPTGRRFMSSIANPRGYHFPRRIEPEGESGRRGFNLAHFLKICFRSSCTASKWVNLLWPVVPAAITAHFVFDNSKKSHIHLVTFILNNIAMIPAANLLGFAGQELAQKLPNVLGMVVETSLGSITEVILFMTLLAKHENMMRKNFIPVIQAAILGSILANLLLCVGLCLFVGGIRRHEVKYDAAVSEVGSNLLLVAGMGLLIPSAFYSAVASEVDEPKLESFTLILSRLTAILLLVAFFIYLWFQMRTHHGIYDDLLAADVEKDTDRHREALRSKLTMVEAIVAVIVALTCVTMLAVFLVLEIETIVHDYHVREAFIGVIVVPLAEKAAGHITALDEAWDNQMNFALSHVLGSTIQTALLNAPLVIIVGWGLGKPMDLRFEIYLAIVLVLAILVVGNFLRDCRSNYLEGSLCFIVYIIVALSTWWLPVAP